MAITLRSVSTLAYGSHAGTTVTAPALSSTGDVITVCLVTGSTGAATTPTAPEGWTQLAVVNYTDGNGFFVQESMWAKPYDGAASWTWTHPAVSSQAVALAYNGVDTSVIVDAPATTGVQTASSGTVNIATVPSITTVTNGARLVIARAGWDGNPISPPDGWTEQYDAPILWVGDRDWATAGATGDVSVDTGDGAATPIYGIIMAALRPAADNPSSADAFGSFSINPTLVAKATKGVVATFGMEWTPEFSAVAAAGPARTPTIQNQQAYARFSIKPTIRAKATSSEQAPSRDINIIAGPIYHGWSATTPTHGWTAGKPVGNQWFGEKPTVGWVAGGITK